MWMQYCIQYIEGPSKKVVSNKVLLSFLTRNSKPKINIVLKMVSNKVLISFLIQNSGSKPINIITKMVSNEVLLSFQTRTSLEGGPDPIQALPLPSTELARIFVSVIVFPLSLCLSSLSLSFLFAFVFVI